MKATSLLCVVLAVAITFAEVGAPSRFAGPHFVMLWGGSLAEQRVMITEPLELMRLTCALNGGGAVSESAVQDRAFVQVSAFWGGPWKSYWTNPKWPDGIRATEAGQQGRYYREVGDRPAVFLGTPARVDPTPLPTRPGDYTYLSVLSSECVQLFEKHLPRRLASNRR